jgi:hypothetical protein
LNGWTNLERIAAQFSARIDFAGQPLWEKHALQTSIPIDAGGGIVSG